MLATVQFKLVIRFDLFACDLDSAKNIQLSARVPNDKCYFSVPEALLAPLFIGLQTQVPLKSGDANTIANTPVIIALENAALIVPP